MPRFLGIDVGGAATRWALVDHIGDIHARGETVGFSASRSLEDTSRVAERVLSEIRKQIGHVEAVTAGITGLSRGSDIAAILARMFATALDVKDVCLMSDIELQCRGHFKQGEGIVVYSGTGSIAGHVTATGKLETAGGRGIEIDDAGGGYWIAAAALRTILRLEDRKPMLGWSSPMGRSLSMLLGGRDWSYIKSHLASLDRGGFAMLARAVADSARAHDAMAINILRQAGAELALLADMVMDRIGPQPIVLTGRAAELHPEIALSMREALPGCHIEQRFSEASVVAARLGFGR